MKKILLLLLLGCSSSHADSKTLFFAKESAKEYTHIALTISGAKITGTKVWQPKTEHGARGTLEGIIDGGNLIQVLYSYTIEGSEQAEEMVLKLDDNQLFIGSGELVEGGNGRMNLKDANKVAFKTVLHQVTTAEPMAGTPERKAIMDAMRTPVTKRIGKPILFTGSVLTSGSWARFQGDVACVDGKAPKNEDAASDLELDFFALLKKNTNGEWEVLQSGFSGDTSVRDKAREDHPTAPWVLFE